MSEPPSKILSAEASGQLLATRCIVVLALMTAGVMTEEWARREPSSGP